MKETLHIEPKQFSPSLKGLKKGIKNTPGKKVRSNLDTLAQLNHFYSEKLLEGSDSKTLAIEKKSLEFSKAPFIKRARSKVYMDALIFQLIDLKSPLKDAYWNTYHCGTVILQDGIKTSSKYCKQRWCKTCNRIRTANLMNGYRAPLKTLKDPYFVTLTIPNVEEQRLKQSIEGMTKTFALIKRSIERKHKIKLRGLRKTESTISKRLGNYHPHFHMIIEGKQQAQEFHNEWLKRYPKATKKGQDIRKANEGTIEELFKYFTKLVTDEKTFEPYKMDVIFRAMKNKRVFQPFGLKKEVSEEIEEIQKQKAIHLGNKQEIYTWDREGMDWVNSEGVCVSGYIASPEYLEILDHLRKGVLLKPKQEYYEPKESSKDRQNLHQVYSPGEAFS